jgi:hypothetical protein
LRSKKIFLSAICFLFIFQLSNAKPVKLQIDSDNEIFPTVRSDERLIEVTDTAFVIENPYILSANSKNEIRLYDIYDNPKAFILLSTLTDLQISRNSPNFFLKSNFGRFRCVTGNDETFIIHAENGVTLVVAPNSDIVYSCVSDLNRMHNVNVAVFNGEIQVYKREKVSEENQLDFAQQDFILNIMPMQIAEIENPMMINIDDISQESLEYFQQTNSRKAGTKEIEKGIRPVLEALTFRQNQAPSADDEIIFSTQKIQVDDSMLIQMPKKQAVITDLANFRFSFLFPHNKVGGSIGWHPSIKTSNNLFEMALRFDIPFLVSLSGEHSIQNTPVRTDKIWEHFLKLNDFRSEWFVDSVMEGNKPEEKVLGVIENLLVKIDKLRWGNENTPFYFMMGTKKAKTDKNALRYFFYSPSLFLPVYRSTSVDFAYRNKYITAEFFAENAPYGGLFDNSIQIFTPLKSMKSRVEIDFAIDTYRLRQITLGSDSKAALPLYTDVGWSFTVFDLSYFGYEFYLNAGLVFPLTADSDNVFSMQPEHIKNMMHFTFGQKIRGKNGPTFSIEILFKSANIHYFTPLYFLFKEKYLTELANKYVNSDYDFGARLGISWQPLDWINLYAFYRPTARIANLFEENKSVSYADNFLTGVKISPPVNEDSVSANLTFALEWEKPVEAIISSIVKKDAVGLYENFAMHACIETLFADIGSFCTDFSILPSTNGIKFSGEVYFTFSIKGIKRNIERRTNVAERRLKNLKKIISENEDEDKNDDIKEESKESSQSEKTAPLADTDGEKNEN